METIQTSVFQQTIWNNKKKINKNKNPSRVSPDFRSEEGDRLKLSNDQPGEFIVNYIGIQGKPSVDWG